MLPRSCSGHGIGAWKLSALGSGKTDFLQVSQIQPGARQQGQAGECPDEARRSMHVKRAPEPNKSTAETWVGGPRRPPHLFGPGWHLLPHNFNFPINFREGF